MTTKSCEGCGTTSIHADDCPALDPPEQPLPCTRTKPHPPHMYMLNRTSRPCPGVLGAKGSGDLYFCPTVGEIESTEHGGFDVCCAHPELHTYLGYRTPGIDAIAVYLSDRARETPAPDVLEHVTRAVARHDMDRMATLLASGEQMPPAEDHPFWTMWRATARNAILAYNVYTERQGHQYLSTGCLHGEHGYCQSNTGSQGQKIPAVCKFCRAPCMCSCHLPGEVTVVERTVNKTAVKRVDEYCYATPPGGVGAQWTGPDNTSGSWGDCDCTKPSDHEGDHACEPCTKRHGAPSWPQEPTPFGRPLPEGMAGEIAECLRARQEPEGEVAG